MGNNSGLEGTTITYYCQQPENKPTVEPMIAVCTRDGYWSPNPDELECNSSHTMTTSTNTYSSSSEGIDLHDECQ